MSERTLLSTALALAVSGWLTLYSHAMPTPRAGIGPDPQSAAPVHGVEPVVIGGALTAAVLAGDGTVIAAQGVNLVRFEPHGTQLVEIGRITMPGVTHALATDGGTVYATVGSDGLWTIDTSAPRGLSVVSRLHTGRVAYDLTVRGEYVYLTEDEGIRTVDLRDPRAPVVSAFLTFGGVINLASSASILVGSSREQVVVFDVTDPSAPTVDSNWLVNWATYDTGLAVWQDLIFAYGTGPRDVPWDDRRCAFDVFRVVPGEPGELIATVTLDTPTGVAVDPPSAMHVHDDLYWVVANGWIFRFELTGTECTTPTAGGGTTCPSWLPRLTGAFEEGPGSILATSAGTVFKGGDSGGTLYDVGPSTLLSMASVDAAAAADWVAWAGDCLLTSSRSGLRRYDPYRPQAPGWYVNNSRRYERMLSGESVGIGVFGTSLEIVDCRGDTALTTLATITTTRRYLIASTLTPNTLYVVHADAQWGYYSPGDCCVNPTLTAVNIATSSAPFVSWSMPIGTPPGSRYLLSWMSIAADLDTIAVGAFGDSSSQTTIVKIGDDSTPAVVATVDGLGARPSIVMDGEVYVAVDRVLRRYTFAADSGMSFEEVPVDGYIDDLVEWGGRVVATVRRDAVSPEGFKGAIYEVAPSEPHGVLSLRHVSDFARGDVTAQAEARGSLLAIDSGALGVTVIEMALPVTIHLPALGG